MNETLMRYRPYLAMIFLFAIVLAGTIFFLRRPEPTTLTMTTATPRPTATPATILVDVRGAVNKPGVTRWQWAVACKMRSRLPAMSWQTPTRATSTSRAS